MEYSTPYNVDIDGMDKTIFKTYVGRVTELPETIRDIMFAPETAAWMEEKIGIQFGLSQDQKDHLTRIIRDICLCDFYIGNIVLEIQARLSLAPDVARKIAGTVVAELLMPALEDIEQKEREKYMKNGKPEIPIAEQKIQAAPAPAPQPIAQSRPISIPPTTAKPIVYEYDDELPPIIDLRNAPKRFPESLPSVQDEESNET